MIKFTADGHKYSATSANINDNKTVVEVLDEAGEGVAVAYFWHNMEQGELIYNDENDTHIYMPSDMYFEFDNTLESIIEVATYLAVTNPDVCG